MIDLYVVLMHDRIGLAGCYKPFYIEPLRRYCARPPRNKQFKLLGIYPSEHAALVAMKHKARLVREAQKKTRP